MLKRAKSDMVTVVIDCVDEGGDPTRGEKAHRRRRGTVRIHATPQLNHSDPFVHTNVELIANI